MLKWVRGWLGGAWQPSWVGLGTGSRGSKILVGGGGGGGFGHHLSALHKWETACSFSSFFISRHSSHLGPVACQNLLAQFKKGVIRCLGFWTGRLYQASCFGGKQECCRRNNFGLVDLAAHIIQPSS